MVNGPQPSVSETENNGSRGASIQICLVNGSGKHSPFQVELLEIEIAVKVTVYNPGSVYVC